jgi:ankyrin repeat protein
VSQGADIFQEHGRVLLDAVEFNHLELVKYFVEQGINVRAQSGALNIAAGHGFYEIVKYLIESGADLHVVNESPLLEAIRNGSHDVVQYLIKHGADVRILDREGVWINPRLRFKDDTEVLRLIIRSGL